MEIGVRNKNVILGVSGGIAAYKSVELLRLLVKAGADVRVVMTENARRFVGPLTFEALSGRAVSIDLFEKKDDASIRHIEWAEAADAMVVAPATANIVGKIANGIADDALSTFILAVTAPVVICPSMNTHMYESKAVQRNLETLRRDGRFIVTPDSGRLACGTVGPGRLPEPEDILDRLLYCLSPKDLKGKKILVTAGPTREPMDPVRFVSNPSSGKMGYAIARAAEHRGGETVLVTGPSGLPDPLNVTVVKVQTAREMALAVFERFEDFHIIIKAAAVSDYSPAEPADRKIKKKDDEMVVLLRKNQDILKELGSKKNGRILVGFAAETEDLEKNAKMKLLEKNLDIIVGNILGHPGAGFDTDTNKVSFYYKDGTQETFPLMAKEAVAHFLLDRIADRLL